MTLLSEPNVLLTSPSYPQTNLDWRGVFIGRLVDALSDRLNLRLWAPPGQRPKSVTYVCTRTEQSFLHQLMQDGGISQLLRSTKMRGIWRAMQLCRHLSAVYAREQSADLVHANWLQTCLGISRSRLPLLVTALGNDMALLRIPGMIRVLRAQFAHRPVVVAPNADWMAQSLDEAFGRQARIVVVPFGMDDKWYQVDREPPVGPRIWLTVARVTHAKLGPLLEWGSGLFGTDDELHLIGPLMDPITLPPWVKHHGAQDAATIRTTWFPRASGLITLSQHNEGRPQVMLEAMASSLPIVASHHPAHADIVHDGHTGFLVRDRDALASALQKLRNPATNRAFGAEARRWSSSEFGNWSDCAARYAAQYEWLLSSPR